jgi:hypothetical protein
MKKLFSIFILGCMISGFTNTVARAQFISGNLNLNPYPSPYTSDWENNPNALGSLVINFNGDVLNYNVQLKFTIYKSGKGKVFTSLSNSILLDRPTVLVDNTKFVKFLDADYPDKKFENQIDQSGRIPEGHYTGCVDIQNADGMTVAGEICSDFSIVYPEPPQLIAPGNGELISNSTYPVFQWSPIFVPSAYQAHYSLRIVKLLPGQIPAKALEANVPQFERSDITGSNFVYPPDALPLEDGATYAWQIQVLDQNGFPASQNHGRSQIYTFTYHKYRIALNFPQIGPILDKPTNGSVVSSDMPDFSWKNSTDKKEPTYLNLIVVPQPQRETKKMALRSQKPIYKQQLDGGQLHFQPQTPISFKSGGKYSWEVQVKNSGTGKIIRSSNIQTFTYKPKYVYHPAFMKSSTVSGKLEYEFADQGEYSVWPLGNRKIKLEMVYVLKTKKFTGSYLPKAYSNHPPSIVIPTNQLDPQKYPGSGHILTTGRSDNTGHFAVSFFNGKKMGLVKKGYNMSKGSGEFSYSITGDLYRVARVVVQDRHYSSPSKDIIVQPLESKDVGQLIAYVRSYQLTVTVKTPKNHVQYQGGGSPLAGMKVYLMRMKKDVKSYYKQIPSNEGAPKRRNPGDPVKEMKPHWPNTEMEIVAQRITDKNGRAVFHRVVKSTNWNEYYWIYTRSDTTKGVTNYMGSVMSKFKYPGDHAVFTDEYRYVNVNQTISTSPLYPRIAGRVKYQGSKLPGLGGAKVQLYNAKQKKFDRQMLSQWYPDMGSFVFNNLNVQFNNNDVVYQQRSLIIQKSGFHKVTIQIPKLKPGEQYVNDNIFLKPNSIIKGEIVNEEGGGVPAQVSVLFGASVKASPPLVFNRRSGELLPAHFKVPAPSGKTFLIVDPTPYNPSYFKETIPVTVTPGMKEFKIVLKRKEKRIRVLVTNNIYARGSYIPAAIVRVETPTGKLIAQHTANSRGIAEFKFTNTGDNFNIIASPPKGKLFESRQITAKVPDSKDWKNIRIGLKKAAFISGKVTVGNQNQPVAGAVIKVVNSSGITLKVATGQDGSFRLNNVPIGNKTYKASKSQSNYIGAKKSLNVPQSGLKNVTFNLSVYADMDISKLMGFPISVDKLTQTGGQVKISGSFEKLDSLNNKIFGVSDKADLTFHDLPIVPGKQTSNVFGKEVPIAKPAALPLKTEENTLNLSLYKSFYGQLRDKKIGIELADDGSGLGVIKGNVWIGINSFSIPGSNLKSMENQGFYLKSSSTKSLHVPVITATGSDPVPVSRGFQVSDSSGGSLNFTLFNYKADADPDDSYIHSGSLSLHTHIHTALQNVTPSDLNLDIGSIVLKPTDKTISPLSGTQKITMKLDKWTLEADKWAFSGNLKVSNGTLNTNLVNVPIKNLQITPSSLINEKFNLKSINLGGIVPLKVNGDLVLGHDATSSAGPEWFLHASNTNSHIASFGGLPGMAKGDSVYIEAFSLYSKSDPTFTPSYYQKPLRIYKVGILKPNTVSYYPNPGFVEISGLQYNIPDLSLNGAIHYQKQNNRIQLKVLPLQFVLNTHGIQANFGMNSTESASQKLNAAGFAARGTLTEMKNGAPLFKPRPLDVWLYHTADSTSIIVEKPPLRSAWQTLNIGGTTTYLNKVNGRMAVNSNSWNYFKFAGNLTGTKGVEQGKNRLAFTVKGEIEADGQHLGIKNVSTPFGNMSWTYEFDNQRLIGTLDIHKDIGGLALDGQAESLVDGNGWYFIAGGKLKVPGVGPANAAMLFGDYPIMTPSIREKFAESSYNKKLPASFENNINGFLFSGALQIPVLVPNIDVNMGFASVGFGVDAGGDVRAWKGFDDGGSEYGIGAIAFAHAYLYMDAITCTSLDADANVELGFTGTYQSSSSTFSLDGCGSFKLQGSLTQQGVGLGDVCTPPTISFSKSYAFKALMHMDSSGNKSLGFGLGTCSGN